jgi:hypothetical protein
MEIILDKGNYRFVLDTLFKDRFKLGYAPEIYIENVMSDMEDNRYIYYLIINESKKQFTKFIGSDYLQKYIYKDLINQSNKKIKLKNYIKKY